MAASRKAKGGAAAAVAAIIAAVVAIEGGYVDHESDPGGKTKYGITEATARVCGYRGDMRDMPREVAVDCYGQNYIDRPGFTPIVAASKALGHEAVDTGVNTGTYRAALWYQESLNHLNRRGRDYADIAEDGKIGPGTMFAYRQLQRVRGEKKACQLMVKLMDAKQAGHYMRLASGNSKFEDFMPGWVDHRLWNVPLGDC